MPHVRWPKRKGGESTVTATGSKEGHPAEKHTRRYRNQTALLPVYCAAIGEVCLHLPSLPPPKTPAGQVHYKRVPEILLEVPIQI